MTFPRGLLVFHGLAIIAGVAGAFLTTRPIEKQPDLSGSIAEEGSIESPEPDLLEIARTTQPADFASVLSQLSPSENPQHASDALKATRLLCRRWIEHDPDEVVAFLVKNESDRQVFSPLLREWVTLDAEGALKAALKVEDSKIRERFTYFTLSQLSENDPELFFEIQESLPLELESLGYIRSTAVKNLAVLNPRKAIQMLEELESDYHRSDAIQAIVEAWSRTDPDAALAWAETLESPATRQKALKILLLDLAENDLETAKSFIEKSGVGSSIRWDAGIYEDVARELAKTDARQAAEWVSLHVPETLQDEAARSLVLGTDDPELAIALLDALPPGKAKEHAASNRFLNWKTGDPEIAWDWIRKNLEGNRRQWALNNLGQSIGRANFDKALAFADSLDDSPEKEKFRDQIITGLGKYDFERAREIARDVGDTDLENDIIAARVKDRAHRDGDPRELAALLSELPSDYQINDPPHFWIAADWNRQDREASLAWAQSFPAGSKAREKSYEGIAAAWTREEPEAAREWFAAEPAGRERDTAFKRISSVLRDENDHPGSFSAALEIGNETDRADSLGLAVKAWMKRDPDAAWNAVETSNLDTAAKERLFRQFQFE